VAEIVLGHSWCLGSDTRRQRLARGGGPL
jgi:hypothetical protein